MSLKTKFGMPPVLWRQMLARRNKVVIDRESPTYLDHSAFVQEYRKLYSNQEIVYRFNSWGMRDDVDYEKFIKQKVVLCVGDSFTANTCGPVEHSWPRLLAPKFNIPVLNLSIGRLGPDAYVNVIDKMREFFDVQYTFALYNLHGDDKAVVDYDLDGNITEKKIHALKKYEWPLGAHVAFDPPWIWSKPQLEVLLSHFPDAHAYLKDITVNFSTIPYDIFLCLVGPTYENIRGRTWPSIEALYLHLVKFNSIENLIPKSEHYIFYDTVLYVCKAHLYRNGDFYHFSKMSNQMVADYFYSKVSGGIITSTNHPCVVY